MNCKTLIDLAELAVVFLLVGALLWVVGGAA